tara:strand:- start:317 stop:541 length:225 start_codon:yes stop_codon:yes gene_type:complete
MKYNLAPKWWSVVIWILAAIVLCGNQLYGQLEVGDISPDFSAPVCENDNTEDGYWSLLDEGVGKVIWIDLYTSW